MEAAGRGRTWPSDSECLPERPSEDSAAVAAIAIDGPTAAASEQDQAASVAEESVEPAEKLSRNAAKVQAQQKEGGVCGDEVARVEYKASFSRLVETACSRRSYPY